ncbi:MAG: ATP synthase F1 subunit delta [Candidatus Latescibacteria bacterium]|nr:ATP synthase F1 subunit delta [Candidatus Latescibacterota bacterium]
MSAPEVVRRYAATLLEAAAELKVEAQVQADVEGLQATLQASADLSSCLRNRLIDAQVHRTLLESLFAGKVQPLTLNFLLLLAERRRAGLLPEILAAYIDLFDARQGILQAEVRSAAELSDEQRARFKQCLEVYTGKTVRLSTRVDRSLKGGAIAQVGDTVFDGSLIRHLQHLHEQLAGALTTHR